MSQSATALIKLAARQGLVPADVARHLVEKIREASNPQQLAESLLVQGGHCTIAQVQRLVAEVAAQATAASAQPTVIGGFKLIERIGAGGMGEVYRALQISMQRTVALKLLSRDLLRDATLGERFLREARAAGAVNHPNVVGCFDVGQADGRYFMALEYVAGGDAEKLMRAYDHRLGERRALEIVRDCARGLEALHDAGFVHRDIKPSNILLCEDGAAKVGDLGLVSSAVPDQRLTGSGTAMGTPAYMSPEQADGARDLDVRTDIYSLGASLFYLLTGHPPYTGQSAWAVVAKVINDPFPDPRRLNPEVSAACAAVVLQATAKDRGQRYRSAGDMRRALDDLLKLPITDAAQSVSASSAPPSGATMTHAERPVPAAAARLFARPWLVPALIGLALVVILIQGFLLMQRPASVPAAPGAAAPLVASTTVAPAATPPPAVAPIVTPAPSAEKPAPAAKSEPGTKPANWLQQPAGAPVIAAPASPAVAPSAIAPPRPAVVTAPAVPAPAVVPPVVAVLGCEAGDLSLRDFAKAFPELLTVALTRKGSFDLVERTQLRQVLGEQELTQSGVIDSANAARIGRLVGARVLITQRVYVTGDYTYVSAKAIDVESGRVKAVSKGDLKKNATPALMAAFVAVELGKAIDALSGATPSESDEVKALIARIADAVRGKRLPTVVIAVEETHLRLPAPDPAVRTELGYLLRKSGFRVIESDSPALATWAKDFAAGRTAPFPADLGAVEVVIAGGGVSESVGSTGALFSSRARLELSAIVAGSGHLLAVERATMSAADASETLAGKAALEKAVRQIALGFISDLTKGWNER